MHVLSPFTDMFGEGGERGDMLRRSMEIIGEEGAGVVVLLASHRGDVFTRAVQAQAGKLEPADMDELRDYGVGAQILPGLGIEEMVMLTNSPPTLLVLAGSGLSLVGRPEELRVWKKCIST